VTLLCAKATCLVDVRTINDEWVSGGQIRSTPGVPGAKRKAAVDENVTNSKFMPLTKFTGKILNCFPFQSQTSEFVPKEAKGHRINPRPPKQSPRRDLVPAAARRPAKTMPCPCSWHLRLQAVLRDLLRQRRHQQGTTLLPRHLRGLHLHNPQQMSRNLAGSHRNRDHLVSAKMVNLVPICQSSGSRTRNSSKYGS
jgi:hypothetical protein